MDISAVYLAAVMFSAWRGGLGAGLLATALSAVLGAYFFFPPAYSFRVYGEDLLQLGVFTLAALIISSLSAASFCRRTAVRNSLSCRGRRRAG
jgi:K+-sensing histidine kinase KdpD